MSEQVILYLIDNATEVLMCVILVGCVVGVVILMKKLLEDKAALDKVTEIQPPNYPALSFVEAWKKDVQAEIDRKEAQQAEDASTKTAKGLVNYWLSAYLQHTDEYVVAKYTRRLEIERQAARPKVWCARDYAGNLRVSHFGSMMGMFPTLFPSQELASQFGEPEVYVGQER